MERQIIISNNLYARLESMAVGFDTAERVIERLVAQAEAGDNTPRADLSKISAMQNEPSQVTKRKIKPREITNAMAEEACKLGNQMAEGIIVQEYAKKRLADMGMNSSSAHIYLYNFVAMRQGKVFKRSMKLADIEMFLEYILEIHGKQGLRIALRAYEQHVEYSVAQKFSVAKKKPLLTAMKKKLH